MKIAFVVPQLSGGGAEYVAKAWATYLSESGHEVIVFSTQPTSGGTEAFRITSLASSSVFSLVRSLRNAIRNEGPDVVIGLMPFWNLLALAGVVATVGSRPKVVVSSHTIESHYGANRPRGFRMQTTIARGVYRFADAFLASSHAVAAEAVARYGIDRNRLWVLPNPVFPVPVSIPERKSGTPSEVITLVVPGRMVDQKRPAMALDVASGLGKIRGTAPRVIFIGDGPALDITRARAESMQINASFLRWSPDWPTLVPTNSVVLLPSMLEGFGNVLLDAAASNLPAVVSSRALGVADAVIPGVTGVLVSGDAVRDYVEGVLATATLIPLDSAIMQSWMSRFSTASSGGLLLAVLRQLVR